MSSSAVQSRLNSQSISAINPDYYIDQNRGKRNLFEVDHVILNGALTLSRDLLNRRKLFLTVSGDSTVTLPSPELCLGVGFDAIFLTGAAGVVTFASTANASIVSSTSSNILANIVNNVPLATVIQSTFGVGISAIAFPANSAGTILKFRGLGTHWFVNGISTSNTAVTFTA